MLNKMWLGTELYNGSFGKKYTQRMINNIISYALEIGIDKIDTAECYGVEKNIGIAIKNKRSRFKIATKFGHDSHATDKIGAFDLDSVKRQLNNSLVLLCTDHIDLYYFHSGSNLEFKNDEVWGYLRSMQEKGIIGELGLSLQHSFVVSKDYYQINKARDYGISVVQTVLNMYSKDSLEYIIPFCKTNKIKVLGRMPLAKGLLSGKYKVNHVFNKSDRRSESIGLNKIIIRSNKNISTDMALKWSIERVDEVVVGTKTKHQLLSNFNAINCI
jgi:myo-inositol catabolism protein IolS